MIDVEDFRRIKRRLEQWRGGANCEHIGVDYEIELLDALIKAVEHDRMNPVMIQIGKSPTLAVMTEKGWKMKGGNNADSKRLPEKSDRTSKV